MTRGWVKVEVGESVYNLSKHQILIFSTSVRFWKPNDEKNLCVQTPGNNPHLLLVTSEIYNDFHWCETMDSSACMLYFALF